MSAALVIAVASCGIWALLLTARGGFSLWRNDGNGTFTDVSAVQLPPGIGMPSIADIDGDGDLDLVASNWGRNSRYQASGARPENTRKCSRPSPVTIRFHGSSTVSGTCTNSTSSRMGGC